MSTPAGEAGAGEMGAGVGAGVGVVTREGGELVLVVNATGALECVSDDVSEGDKLFRFVVHGVLLNGIGLGGLVGNALAAAVLSRPQMRSSVNCLLAGLAAADSLLILTSLLLFGLSALFPYTGRLRYYYYHVCPRLTPLAYPLALVAQTASVYLTLVVTAERWVAVCRPFRARALCTPGRARGAVLATCLFSLLYNAPKFFEVEVVRVQRENSTEAVYCVSAAEFRSPLYVTVYIHWLYLVVMYAVPFVSLAALNACIVRRVRKAQAARARLTRSQRRELGLATMLLVVVLVFFLCNLLPLVTNGFEVFLGAELERLDALVKTSNLLVTINSSVNFLIYVLFGEKFKRVFLKTFCAGRCVGRGRGAGGRGEGGDSPDHTREDSYASGGGERVSIRMSLARNGTLGTRRAARPHSVPRRADPAPTVYYPAPSPAPPPPPPVHPAPALNGHSKDHF